MDCLALNVVRMRKQIHKAFRSDRSEKPYGFAAIFLLHSLQGLSGHESCGGKCMMYNKRNLSSREEYEENLYSRLDMNEHRAVLWRDNGKQHKSAERNSRRVFGNLFQCLSGNEECTHGRIPFGDSFYCIRPLKETSADVHCKPPCSWDAERI